MENDAQRPAMNVGQKFLKVVLEPSRVFEEIRENPNFIIPALIILILSVALTLIILPEILAFTRESMANSGQSAEQMNLVMKSAGVAAVVGVLFSLPLVWLVQAVVLLIYNQLSVGEARFKQLFAVAVYSAIPGVFSQILQSAIVKSIGFKASMQVNTSLALLMGSQTDSFLFRLLSQVELFRVWGLILLVVGGAIMMKKDVKNVGAYVFALWLLLSVGLAALGGLFPTSGLQ